MKNKDQWYRLHEKRRLVVSTVRKTKISGIDCMKNDQWYRLHEKEGVLQTVKEKEIPYTKKYGRKSIWIGHILRRNFLLKHIIEGNIEETGIRGRTRK